MSKNLKNNKRYSFIFETTNMVRNSDLVILEEQKFSNGTGKVSFKANLQEANVLNANKRKYSGPICESITSQLAPKAASRSLLMEID